MKCLICDFETRSQADLKEVGAWAYAHHPSTDILCVGVMVDGIRSILSPIELDGENVLRYYANEQDCVFVAHNVMFEYSIYHSILVERYGYPCIPLERWNCTMARAQARGLPASLEQVAFYLDMPHQKDPKGKRLITYMCKESDNAFRWAPELQNSLEQYCLADVAAESDINETLPQLQDMERKVWLLDQRINERGVKVDIQAVRAVLYMLDRQGRAFEKKASDIGKGFFTSVNQRDKVIEWLKSQGVHTDTLRKSDVIKLMSSENSKVNELLEVRLGSMKTSNAKYTRLIEAADPQDDRIRGMFRYHGAATGRWSGSIVQLQNLPRAKIKDIDKTLEALYAHDEEGFIAHSGANNLSDACSWMLRSMLIAEDEHTFMVGDYAAIEARGVMWLAGQSDALQMFRDGIDIYKEMAMTIYKTNDIVSITPEMRHLGKTTILGCGYGMSHKKFKETCDAMKTPVTEEMAERAVTSYRNRFKKVQSLWYDTERAVRLATVNQSVVDCGLLKFKHDGEKLMMRLPSGRIISYNGMRIEKDELVYLGVKTSKMEPIKTYGARIVENAVQAICRDILAEAMLRLEEKGYAVVMHVHDEIVCETRDSFGSLKEFIFYMSEPPSWAVGFPIHAEGWCGRRYKK